MVGRYAKLTRSFTIFLVPVLFASGCSKTNSTDSTEKSSTKPVPAGKQVDKLTATDVWNRADVATVATEREFDDAFWPLLDDLSTAKLEDSITKAKAEHPATWQADVPALTKQVSADRALGRERIGATTFAYSFHESLPPYDLKNAAFVFDTAGVFEACSKWHFAFGKQPGEDTRTGEWTGGERQKWTIPVEREAADAFVNKHGPKGHGWGRDVRVDFLYRARRAFTRSGGKTFNVLPPHALQIDILEWRITSRSTGELLAASPSQPSKADASAVDAH